LKMKIVTFMLLAILCTGMLCLASNKLEMKLGSSTAAPTSSGNGASEIGLSISDSASWQMFRSDLNHSGCSTSKAPGTNQTIWSFATGGFVDSSPAVFEGKVFVGSRDNKVYSLNATTGTQIWSYAVGGEVFSSSAVAYGKIYFGSYDGCLYALNASDGILVWRNMTGYAIASSPAVDNDGRVFVGSGNNVYAYDAFTGSQLWSYPTGGEVDSSPAVWNGTVYIGSGDYKVYALSASTGTKIWSFATGGTVFSSPAVADGKVYIGSYDHTVYCLSAFDGLSVWNYTTNAAVWSSPAVADGKIYVGSGDDCLYALDAATGTQYWNYTTGSMVYSCPAVADGKVFVGSYDNKTYAFDALTGVLVWSYATGGHVISSPAVADGRLFIGSDDGRVYAFGWIMVPDNYPTIQEAIDAANVGATVFVRNGTYSENVVVNKTGLHLLGECNVATVIDATDLGPLHSAAVNVFSDSVEVSGFTLSRSGETGIDLVSDSCAYCSISNNTVGWETWYGIVSSGNYTRITGNDVHCSETGITLNGSSFNTVDGNTVTSSTNGIALSAADNSIVSNNRISSNANGLALVASNGTEVFHNSFMDNTHQVVVDVASQSNTWDDGYPSGGNYWSDYSWADALQGQFQNLPGSDGLGDTPYTIDLKNMDRYPLAAVPYPDVRVVSITPLRSFGYSILPISLQLENTGNQPRTVNLTLYSGNIAIGQKTVTIPPSAAGNPVSCTINWNTQGILPLSGKPPPIFVRISPVSQYVPSVSGLGRFPSLVPRLRVFCAMKAKLVTADVEIISIPLGSTIDEILWGYSILNVNPPEATARGTSSTDVRNPLTFTNLASGNYFVVARYVDLDQCNQGDFFQTSWCRSELVTFAVGLTTDVGLDFSMSQYATHFLDPKSPGYFILVAGRDFYDSSGKGMQDTGVKEVWMGLLDRGIKKDHMYLMCRNAVCDVDGGYPTDNDVSAVTSVENLSSAIHDWACQHVQTGAPLTVYLAAFSGEKWKFYINDTAAVTVWDLNEWLTDMEETTRSRTTVIISAPCSGSFITSLSKPGRIIVTSQQDYEKDMFTYDLHGDAFSEMFWNAIHLGQNVQSSFGAASSWLDLLPGSARAMHPLLDDNGDKVGSTDFMIHPQLPGDEGYLAHNTHIVQCDWHYPWMSQVVSSFCSSWPPPNVTLWAKVENKTRLTHVTAWMLPPDLVPPNFTSLEGFEMADLDHDGNWTVTIPAANFTNHTAGPSNFTFFITAEEEFGNVFNGATPAMVNVQFTATGDPPPDIAAPIVIEERPLEDSVVCGTVKVNGTVSDDVCIDRVELYANGALQGTTLLPPLSTSYFELSLDTNIFENGNNTILLKACDKTGNTNNQTVTFFVQNGIHDTTVTDVATNRTVIGRGYGSNIDVTVANLGSYQENFGLSICANATCIATMPVTLSSQNFVTVTLTSTTANLTMGNYVLTAYASIVSGENSTANNMLTKITVIVSIPGDINGDFWCKLSDLSLLAKAFNTKPGDAKWNPNADINGNGIVGLSDLSVMAKHYNQHYP